MKIQLLGTAAAPTWPFLFGKNDEYCKKIKQWGGKNIRSRSSALVGDEHLIDLGIDAFYHYKKFNVDYSSLRDIFITHSHEDHFLPDQLPMASQGCYAYNTKYSPIGLYGNETVIEKAKALMEGGIDTHILHPYDSVTTPDGYTWTALPANHKPNEEALNYIIEYKGKTLLYKVDSGPYKDEKLWKFLSNYKFDCIITECTFTFEEDEHEDHEIYSSVLKFKNKLLAKGMINDDTLFYLTHIHYISNGMSHDEMEDITSKDNIHVAYDGIVIEF